MHGILDNMEYYGILVIIITLQDRTRTVCDSLHVGWHSLRGGMVTGDDINILKLIRKLTRFYVIFLFKWTMQN